MIALDGKVDWALWAANGGLFLLAQWLMWKVARHGPAIWRRVVDWYSVRQLRRDRRH